MEQRVDLEIDGIPEDVKQVFDFLKVDKTQRSDNKNNLFDVFATDADEHSLCTGYTDKLFDPELDRMYEHAEAVNHIYFKSYRKNLFNFVAFLSEKFLSCRFKISWIEKFQGAQTLFVLVVEKSCVIYHQKGLSYTIAPNMKDFVRENHLDEYVALHTREERIS